jgi:predicted nuclease of predicted toxin-antitoxin system
VKILIDMNLSPAWVPFLAIHGIEALHWSAVGEISAPDSQILDFAADNGFVVFTHDLDFGAILATRKSRGPSVLQIRTQELLPSVIGPVILRAIAAARDQLQAGAIVTVDVAAERIRLLPI